ncbi:hypothetical protein C8R45DRAFT_1108489 [Mycena sanguinolenta]|nr:hypothetical protein C8R45DRAFT_1108489 [Mycena sanguinolenta]
MPLSFFLELHHFPAAFLLRPIADLVTTEYVSTMTLLLKPGARRYFLYLRTCRYLHNLAFDKSVWLVLLDNLRRRSILDRTSKNLQTLSVTEMIGIVQQLMIGPPSWSPGELDRDPVAEISKTITLHRQTEAGNPGSGSDSVKLLPSARYVLFRDRHILECWNVANDRLLWSHPPAAEHTVLVDFGAEEADADSAIIMICLFEAGGGMLRVPQFFIEMVDLDLRTGTHNCLLPARALYSTSIGDPDICGPLAAVWLDLGYMIINWREKSYFILGGDDWDSRFALIPRHIVVLKSPFPRIQIHLICNETTEAYVSPTMGLHLISKDTSGTLFSPTMGLDDVAKLSVVSLEEIPKLHTFHDTTTEPLGPDDVYLGMHIHASPIRDADYRVWFRGTSNGLVSYQFSIPDDRLDEG